MPHLVIVTKMDDLEPVYVTHCPIVGTSSCTTWSECHVDTCTLNLVPEDMAEEDLTDMDEATSHGLDHKYIESSWMTSDNRCALESTDSGIDAAASIAYDNGVGIHTVEVDYEGDGCWTADLLESITLSPSPLEERFGVVFGEQDVEAAADYEAAMQNVETVREYCIPGLRNMPEVWPARIVRWYETEPETLETCDE